MTTLRPLQSNDVAVFEDGGHIVGFRAATDRENRLAAYRKIGNSYALMLPDGSTFMVSADQAVVVRTVTGTALTGAGFFRGIKITAIVGGPQIITVYDNTSATGTPIDTIVVNDLGTWLWDRPSDVLPGAGARRPVTTGVHVVFSGGTSRTCEVMASAT